MFLCYVVWLQWYFPHLYFPVDPKAFFQINFCTSCVLQEAKTHLPTEPKEDFRKNICSHAFIRLQTCFSHGFVVILVKMFVTNILRQLYIWKNFLLVMWNAGEFPACWPSDKRVEKWLRNCRYTQYYCFYVLITGPSVIVLLLANRL